MVTYQDYEAANETEREALILKAIEEYKHSERYKTAVTAQKYYARENVAISKRLTYMQKHNVEDSRVVFHKLRSGEFPRLVKQLSQYLLGNGVTLEEEETEALGPRFNSQLQKAGIQALVDGVNWGFWNVDHLLVFRATEFVPLLDEVTGDMRVGIRFWKLGPEKPQNIELYEEDGVSRYTVDEHGTFTEEQAKQAYVQTVRVDGIGESAVDSSNYPTIPVFPLYANELKQSEFNPGIKSLVDAIDFISSDLVDGITQIEGVYWTIKNYGGDDVAQLLKELEQLRATYTDGDSEAESHNIEVPYAAKQVALELLRKQIRSDFMALDTDAITGGSLTNVAIQVAETDLGLKADMFEWQVADFIQNILELMGFEDSIPTFKRRTLSNDTEVINNLSTMLADGYIDGEYAIKSNPYIDEEDRADLIQRLGASELETGTSRLTDEPDGDDGDES